MQQDKFLFTSLSIGFIIVALIFFYEDYSPILGMDSSNSKAATTSQVEKRNPIDSDTSRTVVRPIQSEDPSNSGLRPDSYIVKSGDTPFSIATEFNLSIEELVQLNPRKVIDTGEKTSTGRTKYFVAVGETLVVSDAQLN